MSKTQKNKFFVGLAIMVFAFFYLFYVELLIQTANQWFSLLYTLHYIAIAASFLLMDIIQPSESPLTYLIPASVICFYYAFPAVVSNSTLSPVVVYPSPLGALLTALLVVLGIASAFRRKSWKTCNVKAAICMFALAMFCCHSVAISNEIMRSSIVARNGAFLKILPVYGRLCCLLLLPFLKKNRTSGLVLLCIGTVGVAMNLLMRHTPLGTIIDPWGKQGTTLSYYLRFALTNSFGSLYFPVSLSYLIGGMWCCFYRSKRSVGGKPETTQSQEDASSALLP